MNHSIKSNGKLNGKLHPGRIARPDLKPRPDVAYSEYIPKLLYPDVEELVELPMTDEVEQLSDVTTPNPVHAAMMRMALESIANMDMAIVRDEARWLNEQEARWDAAALTPAERRNWDTRRREHESQQELLEYVREGAVSYALEVRDLIARCDSPAYRQARRREEEMSNAVGEDNADDFSEESNPDHPRRKRRRRTRSQA